MDKLTILGLVVGVTSILIGQALEGGSPSILLQGAAFVIVFGGTLGAGMGQCPMKGFTTALRMGSWAFF